ncbi:6532_t:CDS:2, partial [Dentiscutata heterogama]
FSDDEILLIAIAIDPRCKNYKYKNAILTCQNCLKLEYNQMVIDENLELLSNEAILDLSESFISTVFTAAAHKNTLSRLAGLACKYLAIPATSVLCEHLFSQCENVMTKKRTQLTPQIF